MATFEKKAYHFLMNNAYLDQNKLSCLKKLLDTRVGDHPLYFHFHSEHPPIIVQSKSMAISELNDSEKAEIDSLRIVTEIRIFDAEITDYYLLKDLFTIENLEQAHPQIKLNQMYYNSIRGSHLPPVKIQMLLHNTRIVEHTDQQITIAFANQHTIDMMQSNGANKKLQKIISQSFGKDYKVLFKIDLDLEAEMHGLSEIVISDEPENSSREQAPLPAHPPVNQRRKYNSESRAVIVKKPSLPKKELQIPQTGEEIKTKILEIFTGVMDEQFLPPWES